MLMIEVGSFNGEDSLTFHEKGYTVFTFEPKQDLYDALASRTLNLPNYTVINKAVSLVDGEIDFHICVEGGASSILPFKSDDELNRHWTTARQDIHYSGTSYKVQSTRLDTFIEENGLTNTSIDYLHVDAQGADLDVLKSVGKYISNVKAGVVETCYSTEKAIYSNQTDDLTAVLSWLGANGFAIERVAENDVTHCECNVYFKRAAHA
jgi:FkbM family methyltransferase